MENSSVTRRVQGMGFEIKEVRIPSKRFKIKTGYIRFLYKKKLREIDYDVAVYADSKAILKCSVELDG